MSDKKETAKEWRPFFLRFTLPISVFNTFCTTSDVMFTNIKSQRDLGLYGDSHGQYIRPIHTDEVFDTRTYGLYLRVQKNAPVQTGC